MRFRATQINQSRLASVSWHLTVIAIVLGATAVAPRWPSIIGAAIALVLRRLGPEEWRVDLGLRKPSNVLFTLLVGGLGGTALFIFTKLFLQHLCELITNSKRDLTAFDFVRGQLRTQLPWIIWIALSAGFCEEVIYRGTVISRLRAIGRKNRTTEWVVAIASAALFSAGHAYQAPAGVLVTGLIGFLLALIYISSRGLLWPVALMHFTYDFLSLVAISCNFDRILQSWSDTLFNSIL